MNRSPVTGKSLFSKLASRGLIVVIYACVGALLLYLPALWSRWRVDNTLNVCVFSETFAPDALARFQKATGIKVNVTYAEIDDQIYAKFYMNGAAGYDVVNISDYVVHALKDTDVLLPIDKSLLTNFGAIDPKLLGQVYDPESVFSVPHKWYVYGLVYDKLFFKCEPSQMSLDYMFKDPKLLQEEGKVARSYRVCMLDDARDAVFMASIYLHGKVHELEDNQLENVRALLVSQKRWVEAYTLHSSQYFLFAGVVPIALMSSNYMHKIYQHSDRFEFAIPKEGSMVIIENLVIPKASKKSDLAHKFIDFMLSEQAAAINSSFYGFNSSNKAVGHKMQATQTSNVHMFPDRSVFRRLYIPLLPVHMRKKVESVWLNVCFA